MTDNNPLTLDSLSPVDYEHPADTKALDALESTKGLDAVIKAFIKHGIERTQIISLTGSHLRITHKNFPKQNEVLENVCTTLNLRVLPKMYVQWDTNINAYTSGDDEPLIVLTSGAIDRLSEPELGYIIGHEVGHIKSRHTKYHMVAQSLSSLSGIIGDLTLGIGNIVTKSLEFALLRWSRMSELTADRAGLLACQDFESAASCLMKISGLPENYYSTTNVNHFLEQANEFRSLEVDTFYKWTKIAMTLTLAHPWTVLRASELTKWIDMGSYSNIIARCSEENNSDTKAAETVVLECSKCGTLLFGTEVFCQNCGNKIR